MFFRSISQVILVATLAITIPYIIYDLLASVNMDITPFVYLFVVVALLATSYLVYLEGFLALRVIPLPEAKTDYPHATAIIAAYLPNEEATIIQTIESFLRIEYPLPLQVILAYNTPHDLPVEKLLQKIAATNSRFIPMRVSESTSKAENINAVLGDITGEFVGIFDADHHADPSNFIRAWRWISNGYDVVQGHCMIRNGHESWVTRLIAIEFEAIYAVSHVGRARLHDFGIFGGSNGYWRTKLLQQIKMHDFMLTEDIDSSIRIIKSGYKIISDPMLLSKELAPTTIKALWNQRMRWSQGWFQVSLKHSFSSLRSPHLTIRQKSGLIHLLLWRECYPWISMQLIPLIIFWSKRYGGIGHLHWFIPIFVLTTILTFLSGPFQVLFAYLLAAPEIRKHKGWFLFYLFASITFYTVWKNFISLIAQIKELMGERQWKVTPRSVLQVPYLELELEGVEV